MGNFDYGVNTGKKIQNKMSIFFLIQNMTVINM